MAWSMGAFRGVVHSGILATCVLTVLSACKGDKEGGPSPEVVASTEKVAAEEEALLRKRDELFSSRRELEEKRAALDEEHRRIIAEGGDASEILKQKEELAEQEQGLTSRESELNGKLDEILAERRALTQALATTGADQTSQVAAREAGISAREKALATREDRLAQREAALAEREREVTRFKLEECAAGAQPTTIIQTVDAKGSKYTKKDVEPVLKRVRREMSRKGILQSDLPAAAQGLEKEATAAMAEGDYAKARFAAAQLLATVRSTRIDKAFVSAKIGRLSAAMKGKKLAAAIQKDVDELFRDATANYGDGKFTGANRRLNKIYAKIR